jgi:hypothetical protein
VSFFPTLISYTKYSFVFFNFPTLFSYITISIYFFNFPTLFSHTNVLVFHWFPPYYPKLLFLNKSPPPSIILSYCYLFFSNFKHSNYPKILFLLSFCPPGYLFSLQFYLNFPLYFFSPKESGNDDILCMGQNKPESASDNRVSLGPPTPQPPTPLILPPKLIVMAVDRHGASQNWPGKDAPPNWWEIWYLPSFLPD